jgi:predicted acyl esterase
LSIDTGEGAVHVYLEDVALSGRVSYISEGSLRLKPRFGVVTLVQSCAVK